MFEQVLVLNMTLYKQYNKKILRHQVNMPPTVKMFAQMLIYNGLEKQNLFHLKSYRSSATLKKGPYRKYFFSKFVNNKLNYANSKR